MVLKVELKPYGKIIVGDSIITNDGQRARFIIEGDAPVLREKDILRTEEADTPCKKIYLLIQMMYLAVDPRKHHDLYFQMIKDVQAAAPSTMPLIDAINNFLMGGESYKALKSAKKLVAYEKEIMENATCS
jgi:flagellar protein FlbT